MKVVISDLARKELREIYKFSQRYCLLIAEILNMLEEDPDLIKKLAGGKFLELGNQVLQLNELNYEKYRQLEMRRMKIWDVDEKIIPYRILIAIFEDKNVAVVISIMSREVNYEWESPEIQRAISEFWKYFDMHVQ